MANRWVFFLSKGHSVSPKMKTSTIVALIDSFCYSLFHKYSSYISVLYFLWWLIDGYLFSVGWMLWMITPMLPSRPPETLEMLLIGWWRTKQGASQDWRKSSASRPLSWPPSYPCWSVKRDSINRKFKLCRTSKVWQTLKEFFYMIFLLKYRLKWSTLIRKKIINQMMLRQSLWCFCQHIKSWSVSGGGLPVCWLCYEEVPQWFLCWN